MIGTKDSASTLEHTDTGAVTDRAGRKESAITRGRIVVFGVLAIVVMIFLSWGPTLVFYYSFQKVITTGHIGAKSGELLAAAPREDSLSVGPGGDAWHQVALDDVLVSLPAGDLAALRLEDSTLVAQYASGTIIVSRFSPGLARSIFIEEIRQVGVAVEDLPRAYFEVNDGEILRRVAATTPLDYRVGMSELERGIYAAAICAKMRLWEFDSVADFVFLEGAQSSAVFLEDDAGRWKVIVTAPAGFFAFTCEGFPVADVKRSLPMILEVLPLNAELREVLETRSKERYPAEHPVRVFSARSSTARESANDAGSGTQRAER